MQKVEVHQSKSEWKEARRSGLGSSDAAAILGLTPTWASAWSVWAEKRGLLLPEESSEWQKMGHYMEPTIARMYEDETGIELVDPGDYTIYRGTDIPFQFATIDRLDQSGEIVELKMVGGTYQKWRDGVPLYIQVQCQHQMQVMGRATCSVAVLFGAPSFSFQVFHVHRNQRFIDEMNAQQTEFWKLVETDQAPPVDDSDATAAALKRIEMDDRGGMVELPEDFLEVDMDRQKAVAIIKEMEQVKQRADNKIKAAIGAKMSAILKYEGGEIEYAWRPARGGRRLTRKDYEMPF